MGSKNVSLIITEKGRKTGNTRHASEGWTRDKMRSGGPSDRLRVNLRGTASAFNRINGERSIPV